MSVFAGLADRTAVVTGASSGIGRAIAVEFATAGARVLLTCRTSEDRLAETRRLIERAGGRADLFVGDLADPAACDELVRTAWDRLGGVSIWVNNAGVDLLTGEGPKLSYDEKLRRLWEVDVAATVRLSREAGRRMKEAGGGVLLNVGWDQADRGMEGDSGELFATAKNAIMGFTRSLAVSLAPEVRVNCIAPGWIKTAWGEGAGSYWQERVIRETPLRRWGTPEDIAKAARFLCSDDAAFVTGQVFNVNGGAVR
ncbi:MAG TPA: SDR family oxidoreductase [Planctomycetaceae bacterium]